MLQVHDSQTDQAGSTTRNEDKTPCYVKRDDRVEAYANFWIRLSRHSRNIVLDQLL
jgi:hypothetical protein